MTEIQHISIEGQRLAYRHRRGDGPTILYLPGYLGDMSGDKVQALDAWAAAEGRALVRFDYLGRGESDGRFEDQTLHTYREQVLALLDQVIEGPVLIVGSSMGGWLMLLIALARPERVSALVGLAPAPDFTIWGFGEEERRQARETGRYEEPSDDGSFTIPYTHGFITSGDELRLLDAQIPITCPVRLIHGQADDTVPWRNSLELTERLHSADVQTMLIKDADHRLARAEDVKLLIGCVADLLEVL